jgi:release factor glutamine methyltransferase
VIDDDALLAARALEAGCVSFLGLELAVAPGALVPRPETELLARVAIEALKHEGAASMTVVDVGCGSGNLSCAIAAQVPSAHVFALDLAPAAVAVTAQNARSLGLEGRIEAHVSDLFAALPPELVGRIDAIVTNPPYISTGKLDGERASLLTLEPREAFDAGPYGLALHQRIAAEAQRWLRPGGLLACEFGLGQERQLRIVVERARGYGALAFHTNEAGAPRALTARRLRTGTS